MKPSHYGIVVAAASVFAQNVTIPAVDGTLPAAGPNGCAAGYFPGNDTVLFTVPYTYQQVLSIIGKLRKRTDNLQWRQVLTRCRAKTNLTWSGSPDNSVTTNNTAALATNNWTPGSVRTYDIAATHVVETITVYSKPADGPYVEVHTLAPLSIPMFNVSFYANFDGQVWAETCNGTATSANFTINFCATNATTAATALHGLHLTDAQTVGTLLGGQNYTGCPINGTATMGNATMTGNASGSASSPAAQKGAATVAEGGRWVASVELHGGCGGDPLAELGEMLGLQ